MKWDKINGVPYHETSKKSRRLSSSSKSRNQEEMEWRFEGGNCFLLSTALEFLDGRWRFIDREHQLTRNETGGGYVSR